MLWQQSATAYLPVAKPSLKTVKNLLVTSLTSYTLQFHGWLRSILKNCLYLFYHIQEINT